VVIVNICEMRLRPQAIKAELCSSLKMEINKDEITSNIVMKVSYNHLRLAGLLVAGVGCCYSVQQLLMFTINEMLPVITW